MNFIYNIFYPLPQSPSEEEEHRGLVFIGDDEQDTTKKNNNNDDSGDDGLVVAKIDKRFFSSDEHVRETETIFYDLWHNEKHDPRVDILKDKINKLWKCFGHTMFNWRETTMSANDKKKLPAYLLNPFASQNLKHMDVIWNTNFCDIYLNRDTAVYYLLPHAMLLLHSSVSGTTADDFLKLPEPRQRHKKIK